MLNPDKKEVPDEMLMAEFIKSLDNSVFDALVKRHYKGACTFAGNRLSNEESAYDAVQEAFISVVRNRKSYNTSRSFSSWFYKILRNVCIDLYRKQIRYDKKINNWAEIIQLPDKPVNHDYARDLLDQASAQDKEVLILRLVEELSFAEIADFYGCSIDAAKKRCQRALKRLKSGNSLS